MSYIQIFRIQDPESSGSRDPDGKSQEGRRRFGAKNQFLFEMVQKGQEGPKRVPND